MSNKNLSRNRLKEVSKQEEIILKKRMEIEKKIGLGQSIKSNNSEHTEANSTADFGNYQDNSDSDSKAV